MPDILHDFIVGAKPDAVFAAISTPAGLDEWWSKKSSGEAKPGAVYELDFGPGYLWKARVVAVEANRKFALEMFDAHEDWMNTRVSFELKPGANDTTVVFSHTGWPSNNEHYRTSCYCWAAYLRIMRRYVEHGEQVPYEKRLDV